MATSNTYVDTNNADGGCNGFPHFFSSNSGVGLYLARCRSLMNRLATCFLIYHLGFSFVENNCGWVDG